jgi:hypothetical protein
MSTEPADEDRGRWSAEVQRRLGSGASLGVRARAAFEGRLGGDLAAAMVHRGPLAGHLARSLDARALTVGDHVLGDDLALDESTPAGTALLGHELTHVLQRETDTSGEVDAQLVERVLGDQAASPVPAPIVDPDVLAERVYQRIKAQLQRERDRAAWVG